MSEAPLVEMLVLCGTAVGLTLLGLARATLGGRSIPVRLAAVAGCALAAGGLPVAVGFPAAGVLPIALVASAGLAAVAVTTPWGAAALRCLRSRAIQAGSLGAAGGVLFVGGLARYEAADADALDQDEAFMMDVAWKPPLNESVEVTVTTDRGRPVPVHRPITPRSAAEVETAERRASNNVLTAERAIRTGPAADEFNCHGWVFTGGRYWVGPDGVELILADNGYQAVSQPRPGDLIVYRDGGCVTHTGVVRTGGNGEPVLIESKWGWMGRFLHPPDASAYGQSFTYYRSARRGHVLDGLGEAAAPPRPADTGPRL